MKGTRESRRRPGETVAISREFAMLERLRQLFSRSAREAQIREHLERLRPKLPVPVIWLFGRTQSGKTSLVKYLTGAERAAIGKGFEPCTRFSSRYQFPTADAPLVSFLDTRGLDEPGYDADEDLARFNTEAHVVVVTVKAMDHGQENVLTHLRTLRKANPTRPVLLVLSCLHEAYPQQQHPTPYPFTRDAEPDPGGPPVPEELTRSLAEQRRRFAGLYDRVVAVDLTPPEEGFAEPEYGGETLRATLLELLPAALRQTLLTLKEALGDLQDLYERQALPYIIGYSTLAATAGTIPVPLVDLALLSGIQSRMVYHLAQLYGQPMDQKRYIELAGTLGGSIVFRQGLRELIKLVPYFGTVAGAVACGALAGASTFALGKAACYYYSAVHRGHVPKPEELKHYFNEQRLWAAANWQRIAAASEQHKGTAAPPPTDPKPETAP
jgi:uncharacterized protein (DUF697 family)